MASIKSLLSKTASEIFWDTVFDKVTKRNNRYTIMFNPNWDRKIAYDVKNWNYSSWWKEENQHYEIEKEFYKKWNSFEDAAKVINPEFSKWYEDSDRGFVPNNYLFSEFNL